MTDERVKHYIIIEVREPECCSECNLGGCNNDPSSYRGGCNCHRITDAGRIRKVLHDYIKEVDINAADMIFRADRVRVPFTRLNNPYPEIRSIFERVMDTYKEMRNYGNS